LNWDSAGDGASVFIRLGAETLWVIAPTGADVQLLVQALLASDSVGAR
jgi:hypothetical protein